MDLEKVLKEIGVGWYQILICLGLCLTQMFSNLPPMAFMFTAFDVNYRCRIPECENSSTTPEFTPWWLPRASPFKTADLTSKCLRYAPSHEKRHQLIAAEEICPSRWFDDSMVIECSHEDIIFETAEKTIVTEFGLLCAENKWKILMVGTANSLGQILGLPVSGVISDKFGRKNALIGSAVLSAICGTAQSFSNNYLTFVLLEGLNAFVSVGLYATSLILAVELLYAKRRTLASGLLCSINPIMGVILALAHKYTNDWRLTLRYCYIPGLLFVTYSWFIPESIRWMSFHGQNEKVIKLLNFLAEKNKVCFSDSTKMELAKQPKLEDEKCKSIIEAFFETITSKELVFRFFISITCWIFVTFTYYGMSIDVVSMSENKYLDFILSLAVEIPGVPLSAYLLERFGRKHAISGMYTLAAVAFLLYALTPAYYSMLENVSLKLVIFLLAKIATSMAFNSQYVHTVEIYPTELRQSLLNLCAMFGRLGFVLAVVNPQLRIWWEPLPIVLFSATSLLSAFAILASPETHNRRLPDTVMESVTLEKADK